MTERKKTEKACGADAAGNGTAGNGAGRKVFRAKKLGVNAEKEGKVVRPESPITDEAMERLSQIMNDTPSLVKLKGTEWEIRGLKPGVQWLISEEACRVVKEEKESMGDVLREFSKNLPAVVNVLTLALLNDKERIFSNYGRRVYSEEYVQVRDALLWGDYELRDWALLLSEVLRLVDVGFFFESTNVIKTVREMTLGRKMTKAEAE